MKEEKKEQKDKIQSFNICEIILFLLIKVERTDKRILNRLVFFLIQTFLWLAFKKKSQIFFQVFSSTTTLNKSCEKQ